MSRVKTENIFAHQKNVISLLKMVIPIKNGDFPIKIRMEVDQDWAPFQLRAVHDCQSQHIPIHQPPPLKPNIILLVIVPLLSPQKQISVGEFP